MEAQPLVEAETPVQVREGIGISLFGPVYIHALRPDELLGYQALATLGVLLQSS